MSEFLSASGTAWAWIVLGILLCALELAAPGAFLLWLGFAAIALGLVNFVADLPLVWDLLLGSGLAAGFAMAGRRFYGGSDDPGGGSTLNRRAHALVGQSFVLDGPIEAGYGRIRVADSTWRVTGPDMVSGARVRVTGVAPDHVTLMVAPDRG